MGGELLARILVVDDDDAIRLVLRIALEYNGYEVVEAQNGCEGLQRYEAVPVDLVITDMQMPQMDGRQMLIELRRRSPKAKVIAISGRWQALTAAGTCSAQRIFEKPFRVREILGAVAELISTPDPSQDRAYSMAHASHLQTCV